MSARNSGIVGDVLGSEAISLGGHETILVVEDDPLIRKLTTRVLDSLGYAVLQAENGVSALAVVAAHRGEITLLLSDVVMPEMNGQILADRLRAQNPKLKVLYVSGYTDNAIVLRGVSENTIAFLQKPYTPTALARKVRAVLDES